MADQGSTISFICSGTLPNELVIQEEVPDTAETVSVENWANDIAFMEWAVSGSNSAELNQLSVSTGGFTLGNSDLGSVFSFEVTGPNGSDGASSKSKDADPGGPGERSNDVVFAFSGTAFQMGETQGGTINLVSVGTGGGEGGNGGFTECNPITNLGSDCNAGDGGIGGLGGDIMATLSGDLTFGNTANTLNGTPAINIGSDGGSGGAGGQGFGTDGGLDGGGNGGPGGDGGQVVVVAVGSDPLTVTAVGNQTSGLLVRSIGGGGQDAGKGSSSGGIGGPGGAAGDVCLDGNCQGPNNQASGWTIETSGDQSYAIQLLSDGGLGGSGENGTQDSGGNGERGGPAGDIVASNAPNAMRHLTTSGNSSPGVLAKSVGGAGGFGGSGGTTGDGGSGGFGGAAGNVDLGGLWDIETSGDDSVGIAALSLGGPGGQGGDGGWCCDTSGGGGGASGAAGDVTVALDSGSGGITTKGTESHAILAQSIGGHAGSAGTAESLVVSFAASAGSAGAAGDVTVANSDGAAITTEGNEAVAIFAQSVGGGGGNGGDSSSIPGFADFYAQGGNGSIGADGGSVSVENAGTISISGNSSGGILAQSLGGTGGSGGTSSAKIVSLGGRASDGANGGTVTINNSGEIQGAISTGDADGDAICQVGCSPGIVAQSIGGGGGVGGSSLAEFSIGGRSGGGGNGGEVSVSNSGVVTPADTKETPGIHAQSIGGGGGRGGAAIAFAPGASIAIGAQGGVGGHGGSVTIESSTPKVTGGNADNSHGLWAQSIGGGGGHGGTSASISGDFELPAVALAVGADGGGGGDGGQVKITSAGDVDAFGDDSSAIFGQSVGGGGGTGGLTLSGTATVGEGSAGLAMAFGGNGGTGGSGGAVSVSAIGSVFNTSGKNSSVVVAQSVGGGGGKGGFTAAVNANFDGEGNFTMAQGGKGGIGGVGGEVTVDSTTVSVTTAGDESSGILAQSVGGGGGKGGMTFAGDITTSESVSVDLSLGGNAGDGATGGKVQVTTALAPSSLGMDIVGNRSKGIFAQSVGGGGGDGGMTFNGSLSGSTDSNQYQLNLGSNGGDGGAGGAVTVSNVVAIATGTAGQQSFTQNHGIFAQSVGGGGGSGAITGTLQLAADSDDQSHDLDLEMSGSGDGGTGGTVEVTNSGAVSTVNKNSHALFAQSIGGGGGDADSAFLSLADLAANDPQPTFSTEYTASGTLGSGNTGGMVTVTNSGALTTQGRGSHGVFAQSVGGGGGSSGSLGNPFTNCGNSEGCNAATTTWNATVQLGGQTGSGGDGGDLTVTNSADVTTDGPGSYAIFAQTIGAGGGSAGDASALSQGSQAVGVTEFTVLNTFLGAVDGSSDLSGDGGSITVMQNDGLLTTQGIGSTAIYAQSVGAGGGRGGTGAIGQGGSVSVGGGGAASGDGGDVSVTVGSSAAIMAGAKTADSDITVASYGIFAQSVGGGGGHAGNVSMATNDFSLYGSAKNLSSNDANAAGNGGAVTVNLNGSLVTQGKDSIGIFAQSVGGSGGVMGEVTGNPTGATIGSNGGNVGNDGNVKDGGTGTAGPVTVDVTGSITTSGQTAHGVFAQSAGGAGTSTTTNTMVAVTVSGSIEAGGAGANGIFAQSSGDSKGPIEITIEAGATVTSGGALTGAATGAGIVIQEGTTSSIVNKGTIRLTGSTNPDAGVAIRAVNVPGVESANEIAITNSGTIDGWICVTDDAVDDQTCNPASDLASAAAPPAANVQAAAAPTPGTTITLVNEEGGVLNAGNLYEVAHFENRGTLRPGGPGIVSTLNHRGDFVHTETGQMEVTLDASNNTSDTMHVSGKADLRGGVIMEVINLGGEKPRESVTILVADGGISDSTESFFNVAPSVVAGYELQFMSQNQIDVSYKIDFANQEILAGTNRNGREVAQHIQNVFADGALEPALAELIELQDVDSYQNAVGSLDGQIYADNQLTTLYSSQLFKDSMLSCGERSGDFRFISEAQCSWLRGDGRHLNRDQSSASRGFDETAFQFAGGGQINVDENWLLGGALSFEYRSLDEDGGFADSDGWQFQGGLVAKRQFGATLVSGGISGGYASFDADRNVFSGATANGDQDIWLVSGQLRAEHAFEFSSNWYVKPRGDLGVDYISSDSLTESGAGGLDLRVSDSDDVYVYLQPAVEVGFEHAFDSGILVRPWLSVGVTQFLTSDSPSVTASFTGDPSGGGSFNTESELDRTYLDLEAGITVFTVHNVNVSAVGQGRLSSDTQSYGGGLRASILF